MTRVNGPDGKWVEIENLAPKGSPEREQQIKDAIDAKYNPERQLSDEAIEQTKGLTGDVTSLGHGMIEALPGGNLLNRVLDYAGSGINRGLNRVFGTDYIENPDQMQQFREQAVENNPTMHSLGFVGGSIIPGGMLARGAQVGNKTLQYAGQRAADFIDRGSNVVTKGIRGGLLAAGPAAGDAATREAGEQYLEGYSDPTGIMKEGLLGGAIGFGTGGVLESGASLLGKTAGKSDLLSNDSTSKAVSAAQKNNPMVADPNINEYTFSNLYSTIARRDQIDGYKGPLIGNPQLPAEMKASIADIIENGTDAQKRELSLGLTKSINNITSNPMYNNFIKAMQKTGASSADVNQLIKRYDDTFNEVLDHAFKAKQELMKLGITDIPTDIRKLRVQDLPTIEAQRGAQSLINISEIVSGAVQAGTPIVRSLLGFGMGKEGAKDIGSGLKSMVKGIFKNKADWDKAADEAKKSELLRNLGVDKLIHKAIKLGDEFNTLNQVIPGGNYHKLDDTMRALAEMERWHNALNPANKTNYTPSQFRLEPFAVTTKEGMIAKGVDMLSQQFKNRPSSVSNQQRDELVKILTSADKDTQLEFLKKLSGKQKSNNVKIITDQRGLLE